VREEIDDYFARYPKVKEYFAELEEQVNQGGCVTTLFGRKRFVSEIDARGRDRGFVRRAALNAPIQGTAADIIKLAMVKIGSRRIAEDLPFEMMLQIHDELVFECDRDFCDQAVTLLRDEMEGVVELNVPLKVDVGVGENWLEAHS